MRAVCERASRNCYAVLNYLKSDIDRTGRTEPMAFKPETQAFPPLLMCSIAGAAATAA